jgi:hypothetical protein
MDTNGIVEERDAVADGVELVAGLMVIAAVTAPKTKGENFVQTKILRGEAIAKGSRSASRRGSSGTPGTCGTRRRSC